MNLRLECSSVFIAAMAAWLAVPIRLPAVGTQVIEDATHIEINAANYRVHIARKGFRFGFIRSDGKIIAPPHAVSGLEFAGGHAVDTALLAQGTNGVFLEVRNDKDDRAVVQIEPAEHHVRFSVSNRTTAPIVARTGGISPVFGLGDTGVLRRDTTELTGYVNDDFRSTGGQCGRLISNFAIFPQHGFAGVNIEPGPKIVRLTRDENAQGSKSATVMPALYYFFGSPEQIYASFLDVRNRHGWRVFKPKYEWFGVGWEAWGALAWDTNQKTVTENVNRYLDLGYPLSWMVVGSGFWPRHEPRFHATTSFGLWDTNLYPDPRGLIESFQRRGLKFILGLRISFITNGPFASAGVRDGFFIQEDGAPKVFNIGFPRSPCYLLDAQNPAAVRWYIGLCWKWHAFGVDGFKEDLFGYGKYVLRDDKVDPINAILMDMGFFVMGRNGYLGSPADLHRFEDFNFNQNQDRGPINGLAFAYSGFPYVYPDIVGGTFTIKGMPPLADPRLKRYFMRNAQYASVNPAMSVGFGPWNFQDAEVNRVVLDAARLHARLQPYIYSAAVDAAETGFPWTLAPLTLLWSDDPEVFKLENATRRGYQWMLGPSLLACPLYGDDYATATARDVYLPAGGWMDYDTGEVHDGPRTLKNFALPPGKTPLFVGGKGVLVRRDLEDDSLWAAVYPVAPNGSEYRFTHPDGLARSRIVVAARDWQDEAAIEVTDTTSGERVAFRVEKPARVCAFRLLKGHDYRITLRGHRN